MDRKKLLLIIEPGDDQNIPLVLRLYDTIMFFMITISLIPLMFRDDSLLFYVFEKVSVSAFIIDYVLRWITADLKFPEKKKWVAFVTYPFTVMAIIDIMSILPALGFLHQTLKALRVIRVFMLTRIIRLMRYSKRIMTLLVALKKERVVLLTVLGIAVFYIFTTALIMFNVEMDTQLPDGSLAFQSFFDALYWATITLTTVGYGDMCPISEFGRFVSMVSAVFGVAIIALPSGVITASYLEELRKKKEEEKK